MVSTLRSKRSSKIQDPLPFPSLAGLKASGISRNVLPMNGCQSGPSLGAWSMPCGSGAFRMESILGTSLFSPLVCAKLLKCCSFVGNPEGRTKDLV